MNTKNAVKVPGMIFFVLMSFCFAAQARSDEPLQTVKQVDLERYMGQWYEIASFPKWFSRNCVNAQASYTLQDNSKVGVVNECRKGSATGKLVKVSGVARAVDESNAKLKVKFRFNPFEGDYWVIELGEDYEYAVVSEPNRKSLWILSRTETMDPDNLPCLETAPCYKAPV